MRHKYYDQALKTFMVGVHAADPVSAVKRALNGYEEKPTIISVGKAAVKMMSAANEALDDFVEAIAVTNSENFQKIEGVKVFISGHPIPNENGITAGQVVIKAVKDASKVRRPILCLISGGGSALLPAPRDGISLREKIELNSVLLASGADIKTINLIRQKLSLLKGGGLLRYAKPSHVTGLILSDVVDDDLRVVSSGLTTSGMGSREEACQALKALGVWEQISIAIKSLLVGAEEVDEFPIANNILVGSNILSLNAMSSFCPSAIVHHAPLVGDVANAAVRVASVGRGIHLFGGETTVKINGKGKGGRNQELALRVALLADERGWNEPWLYLQAGTDGRDGPTDAAGGVVCDATIKTLKSKGIDLKQSLSNNDSYNALKHAGALLITGTTGTNVADLGILIKG